jgi:hypothetical protein
MQSRDRVRELRRLPAAELLPNPRNWRTHPARQREAMQAVLTEIGYADALLARETADGRLMLIDGHLRAETTPETVVPVLVLDVTEKEADALLATLDPLAGLAESDSDKLSMLLADVRTERPALRGMLADLTKKQAPPPGSAAEELRNRFDIIITCADELEQVELLERLTDEGFECRALVV